MKTDYYVLTESDKLTPGVRLLRFAGDTSAIHVPGQFAAVTLPGLFLRRPFSIMDWGKGWFELLVEDVGTGTQLLHELPVGSQVELMTGLGNGFSLSDAGLSPVLVGGGTGISPLLGLAKRLSQSGRKPHVVLGFRTAEDVCLSERYRPFAKTVTLYTEDGRAGLKGRVTDAEILEQATKLYACGPDAMLRALDAGSRVPGEFALDVRMGCGFGACMGCSIRTRHGMKRVCKDGPVFRREELVWDA